ncbi:hypothetical protein AU254_00515 [Yersinia pestis]|nr:hypothetical protein AU254_00515 [Yersinia pestis]
MAACYLTAHQPVQHICRSLLLFNPLYGTQRGTLRIVGDQLCFGKAALVEFSVNYKYRELHVRCCFRSLQSAFL